MSRFIADEQHLMKVLGIPFSPEQLPAITAAPDRPGVIVAGAGSGKTTVMAARVVWLVGHVGLAPGEVLGLTFTKKAAAELGRRVRTDLLAMGDARDVLALFDHGGEPTVSTYNAFAGSLIDEHGLRLGLETDLRVTADATRFQRAARVIRRFREPLPNIRIKLTATIERVLTLDGALSEHLVSPEQLRAHDLAVVDEIATVEKPTKPVLAAAQAALERIDLSRLVEAYRADKAIAGVMDFSDQMAGGARLAIEVPEVGELMRERFSAVMLDEYQDTSVAQRRMLQGLFGEGHPVTAVGDPAQGIYGWRGASADNIDSFPQHFPRSDGAPSPRLGLRTSRRCHPDVLAVANRAAAPFYASREGLEPLLAPDEPAEGWPDAEVTVARHHTISDELTAVVDGVAAAREAEPDESVAILLRARAEMPTLTAALRARGIDAEVVGLAGLLTLPHVNDVVSLLDVVADATANPSMIRLLTGDRWRIGARDLALLGQRAAVIARGLRTDPDESLEGRLADSVTGSDPTEVVSLADAVADPGDLFYSPEARARFGEIAAVVRTVRRGLGGSIADVVRLAIRQLDLDVETALLGTGASADLAVLVDVADDMGAADVDSLPGFVAYLRAEEEFGQGLEVPERAREGAVQVLTVHTSKGLEWDRVFVPLLSVGSFPSTQGREKWTSTSAGFPNPLRGDADVLPRLSGWSNKELDELAARYRADSADEEVRLAYVAFTRARRALHVSGHAWGRSQKNPREASPFLEAAREVALEQRREVPVWAEVADDETNPELVVDPVAWPPEPLAMPKRRRAAQLVRDASTGSLDHPDVTDHEADQMAMIEALDRELEQLRDAEPGDVREVELPATLSTTSLMGLVGDPAAYARALARPVPRKPSTAARFGTRFHAWIESHFGIQPLLDPTELPGRADSHVESDRELAEVVEQFLAGPYADRTPVGIEVPFSLTVGGQHVIGRIDAVFTTDLPDGGSGFEVVDWKTNRSADADPLQLAVYRLAWAELRGVPVEQVTGSFHYVRLGETSTFDDLPDRAALEGLLG